MGFVTTTGKQATLSLTLSLTLTLTLTLIRTLTPNQVSDAFEEVEVSGTRASGINLRFAQ